MHSTLVVAHLDLLTYVDGVLCAPREPLKTPVVQKKMVPWYLLVGVHCGKGCTFLLAAALLRRGGGGRAH